MQTHRCTQGTRQFLFRGMVDNVRQVSTLSQASSSLEAAPALKAKATGASSPVVSSSKAVAVKEDAPKPVKKNRNSRRGGKHHKAARERRKAEKARVLAQEQKEKEQYEYDILCMDYAAAFPSLQVSVASPVFESRQSVATLKSPFQRDLDALPAQLQDGNSFSFSDLYVRLSPRRMLRSPSQRSLKSTVQADPPLSLDDIAAISALNDVHRALWTARQSYASALYGSA